MYVASIWDLEKCAMSLPLLLTAVAYQSVTSCIAGFSLSSVTVNAINRGSEGRLVVKSEQYKRINVSRFNRLKQRFPTSFVEPVDCTYSNFHPISWYKETNPA